MLRSLVDSEMCIRDRCHPPVVCVRAYVYKSLRAYTRTYCLTGIFNPIILSILICVQDNFKLKPRFVQASAGGYHLWMVEQSNAATSLVWRREAAEVSDKEEQSQNWSIACTKNFKLCNAQPRTKFQLAAPSGGPFSSRNQFREANLPAAENY